MTILKTIAEMGYTVRLAPPHNRLAVTPWSTCPDETRQWFSEHRAEIESALRGESTVGSHLRRVIERSIPARLRAKVKKSGCGCQDYERKCNAWGIDGCRGEHRDEIVAHLARKAKELNAATASVPESLRRLAAAKMLDRAIEKEIKHNPTTPRK